MTNEMKVFFVTLSAVPSLFCMIMAAVLAYHDKPPETWGWFLGVSVLGFFLFGAVMDDLFKDKK